MTDLEWFLIVFSSLCVCFLIIQIRKNYKTENQNNELSIRLYDLQVQNNILHRHITYTKEQNSSTRKNFENFTKEFQNLNQQIKDL